MTESTTPSEPSADANPEIEPASIVVVQREAGKTHEESLAAGFQKLDPKWITANRIKHWISGGIISAIAIIYLFAQWLFLEMGFIGGVIVFFPIALLVGFMVFRAHYYPALWHQSAGYEVDRTAISIHTGIVFKSVMTVPRSRVQHTDVGQGPLMRRYNIASLSIHTAGTQHARVVLPGLTMETAEQIRDHLIARVSISDQNTGSSNTADASPSASAGLLSLDPDSVEDGRAT